MFVVHLKCTAQIGSKISSKISLQGYIADNLQKQSYVSVLLVKSDIPLFWKIGSIWRVKNNTEMWSLVMLTVLYLTFSCPFTFWLLRIFTILIRSFASLSCASFKGRTLAVLWTGRSLVRLHCVWQRCKLCNCVNWGTSANQCYCVDQHTPHTANSNCPQKSRPTVFEFVCSSLSLLVIVVFCFHCKCDVIFLFSLDQSWTENCIV